MSRDSYRKALTSYGPHTADYMVTRLVRMAAAMKGGAELAPEPLDVLADVDELRQQTESMVVGAASGSASDARNAGMHNVAGPPQPVAQPRHITRPLKRRIGREWARPRESVWCQFTYTTKNKT